MTGCSHDTGSDSHCLHPCFYWPKRAVLKVEVSSSCGYHSKLFLSHGSCSLERRRSFCLGWWLQRSSVPRLLKTWWDRDSQGLEFLGLKAEKLDTDVLLLWPGSSSPEYQILNVLRTLKSYWEIKTGIYGSSLNSKGDCQNDAWAPLSPLSVLLLCPEPE